MTKPEAPADQVTDPIRQCDREAKLVEEMARAVCRAAVLVAYPDAEQQNVLDGLVEYFWPKCMPEARAILPIIKAAEADALERAAKVADEYQPTGFMSDRERDYCIDHGQEITDAIRQLGTGQGV